MAVLTRARDSAVKLLFRTGITAPARRCDGRLTVATFHRVLPEEERDRYPYPGLAVTPRELGELIGYFVEHFDCGSLAVQHERHNRDDVKYRPLLALTFDDGQYDNFLHARPILARHGIKATFFIPVEAIQRQELLWHDRLGFAMRNLLEKGQAGRKRLTSILASASISARGPGNPIENTARQSKMLSPEARLRLVDALEDAAGAAAPPPFARPMTFEELAELAAEGHEVGSHSMTHRMMPECDDRALQYEMLESRRILQTHVAHPVDSFCYPNGDCDTRSARAVAAAGYQRAVSTRWGRNEPGADVFALRRCDMDADRMRDQRGRILPALVAFRMSGLHPRLG